MKTLRQFEVVAEIARQQSVSKAAEVLSISQPTVSRFLHNLEMDLGLELFDRTVMPLRLTLAGERYLQAANKILDANRQLEKELRDIRNTNNVLRIGISPSRAPYIMPAILAEYRAQFPDTRIIVQERTVRQLNEGLLRGEFDLIINLLTDETRSFAYETLFTEGVLLVAPYGMAELSAEEILKNQQMITIGKGQKMWEVTEKVLTFFGGQEPMIECQSIEAALALVRRGMGAMLVPSYIAESGRGEDGVIVYKKLPPKCVKQFESDLHREVCVFYRDPAFLTQAERGFIAASRKINQSFHSAF